MISGHHGDLANQIGRAYTGRAYTGRAYTGRAYTGRSIW